MVWRGDIQTHYDNVSKTFDVLKLIDNNDLQLKNSLRTLILKELINSCNCIIEWIDDNSNVNSEIARLFIESLQLGYDITVVIEVRTFIYELLDKPLSDLLKTEVN